jgi:tetratricopeptide (TPR) repeat protein
VASPFQPNEQKLSDQIPADDRTSDGGQSGAANGGEGFLPLLPRYRWIFGLLVLGTVLAYQPVWRAGFIWDDDAYVTQNALLTAPDGLNQIWFSAHRQSQYFPLVYTLLRFERALWGLNPLGYHLVNVLLHAANAVLLWQLLRRLAVPGAWLAAAIFALHPVQVESVAWITELKNVQSTLFYLLALLAWVKFIRKPAAPAWGFYGLALWFEALALFSKTTACTLPAALLLVLWWRRETIGWRRILQVLPFLLMGLAMGVVSVWWEKHLGDYADPDAGVRFGFAGKMVIATRAVWFYAVKVFWPLNLTFIYPRWEIDPRAPLQYLGLAGCMVFALLLWWRRRVLGRRVTAGVVFFVAALSPLLGFIPLYTFRYSFVADHYQYLACAGLIIPIAALISNRMAGERPGRIVYRCLSGSLLLLLGFLTWKQSHIYADPETLWRDTLAKNPACWLAYNNLGNVLLQKGRVGEAIIQIKMALAIKPGLAEGYYNLGDALVQKGQMDEAMADYQKAIEIKPDYAAAHSDLGYALLQKGQTNEALVHYQTAVGIKPDYAVAQRGLAFVLSNEGLFSEAIYHYEIAALIEPQNGWTHHGLGMTLLKTGRTGDAIPPFLKAVEDDPQNALYKDDLGLALSSSGHEAEAASSFLATARSDPAGFGHFFEAMQFDTNHVGLINNLAWSFAANPDPELRNGKYAVRLATRACEMTGFQTTVFIGTLAAAYAEAGRFDEAVATGQKACALASELGETNLLKRNQELVILYQAHQPYHEPPPNSDASQPH